MIERHVFVKLKPAHSGAADRRQIEQRSLQLATVPGVLGVTVAVPADASAAGAWDLCLTVRLASLAAVDAYLEHPGHEAYYEGFLEPMVEVVKAWNFELRE